MKEKIFQRGDKDCTTAAIATLLEIPYEQAPQSGPYGVDMTYTIYPSRRIRVLYSDIDTWLAENGYRWGIGRAGVFKNSSKFYLGILSSPIEEHCVVMKGPEIWHDPSSITYKLGITALDAGFKYKHSLTIHPQGRISKWLT